MRPGCADDDVRAPLEPLELGAVGDATVDREGSHAAMRAQLVELCGHLIGELPGRQQHDCLGLGELDVD